MVILFLVLLAPWPAIAQSAVPVPPTMPQPAQPDVPLGAPYNAGLYSGPSDSSVPLRDFMSSRIDAVRGELFDRMDERDRRYEQRFQAASEAVKIALDSINVRLLGVNEFRQTLSDQQETFATRDSFNALNLRLEDTLGRITALATRLTTIESSGSPAAIQNAKDISALGLRLTESESRTAGQAQFFSVVGTAAGLIFGVIGAWAVISSRRRVSGGKEA